MLVYRRPEVGYLVGTKIPEARYQDNGSEGTKPPDVPKQVAARDRSLPPASLFHLVSNTSRQIDPVNVAREIERVLPNILKSGYNLRAFYTILTAEPWRSSDLIQYL